MPPRRLFLCAILASGLFATAARGDHADIAFPETDWWIVPDPPSNDKDLEVTYTGDEVDVATATYTLDGGKAIEVDLRKNPRFKIPASVLRGHRILQLHAEGGGEAGFRVIRFPSPR